MTHGALGDRHRRDRDRYRRWWIGAVILSGLVALTLAAGAGLYGYDTGSLLAQREVSRLNDQARVLHRAVAELRQSNRRLTAALEVLELRELEWKQRFEADPAMGAEVALLDLIRRRRADGVDAERLKLVLGAIPVARDCDPRSTTKRFAVATPTAAGDAARFAEVSVTVTAAGEPATDAEGNSEPWFEPARPITVRIALAGAETAELWGLLPLSHSLVVDDSEYLFGLAAGGRGLVEVSFRRCRFP